MSDKKRKFEETSDPTRLRSRLIGTSGTDLISDVRHQAMVDIATELSNVSDRCLDIIDALKENGREADVGYVMNALNALIQARDHFTNAILIKDEAVTGKLEEKIKD